MRKCSRSKTLERVHTESSWILLTETRHPPLQNRKLIFIMGGMTILGMLALIALVLFSSFPGPPQGSPDKAQAPEEDVSKAEAVEAHSRARHTITSSPPHSSERSS